MELLINGEVSREVLSAPVVLNWFAVSRDPGDFLVLRDAKLGEVRATAPHEGVCVIQADLSLPSGRRRIDAQMAMHEAASASVRFLKGDTSWTHGLQAPNPELFSSRRLIPVILFLLVLAALLVWLAA